MLVRDIMIAKVISIPEETSFAKIVHIMLDTRVSGLPVLDDNEKIVGIVSEKDLLHQLFPTQDEFYKDINYYKDYTNIELEASKIRDLRAKDIMTKDVITVSPDSHVLVACSLVAIHGIRRIPVVENEDLIGIVSTSRLYKHYLSSFFN